VAIRLSPPRGQCGTLPRLRSRPLPRQAAAPASSRCGQPPPDHLPRSRRGQGWRAAPRPCRCGASSRRAHGRATSLILVLTFRLGGDAPGEGTPLQRVLASPQGRLPSGQHHRAGLTARPGARSSAVTVPWIAALTRGRGAAPSRRCATPRAPLTRSRGSAPRCSRVKHYLSLASPECGAAPWPSRCNLLSLPGEG
jgi:hypothetical protein